MQSLRFLTYPALAAAAGVELLAAYAVWTSSTASALAFHVSCALLTGLAIQLQVPPASSRAGARPAVAAALVATFLPGTGLLGVALIALPSWSGRAARTPPRMREREMPSFSQEVLEAVRVPRIPQKDALDPRQELEQRIAAVKALRHMEPSRAVPLLRRALSDPAEDVRLLAHAIFDRRERGIRAELDDALAHLGLLREAGAMPEACARLHAEIASHAWELIYGGFVAGDAMRGLLADVAEHAIAACPHEGLTDLVRLAIRAQLRLGQLDRAAESLRWAGQHGVEPALLAPLAAELAFMRARFTQVRGALARLPAGAALPSQLGAAARFWTREGGASHGAA